MYIQKTHTQLYTSLPFPEPSHIVIIKYSRVGICYVSMLLKENPKKM